MSQQHTPMKRSALAAALALAGLTQAQALEFQTDSGWKGVWKTTASLSSGWRTADPDKSIMGPNDAAVVKGYAAAAGSNAAGTAAARAAGYVGMSNADTSNLNYEKGDRYATLAKVLTELTLVRGDAGLKLGAKFWYDQALKDEPVAFGNQANGMNGATSTLAPTGVATLTTLGAPRPLSDSQFPALNKFSGAALREAHIYNTFQFADGSSLHVKAGNQLMLWGLQGSVQGLSKVSPRDATAARKPGAEAEESLLPLWAVSGSYRLKGGVAVEGFYQLAQQRSNIESCGTLFAAFDFGAGSTGNFCGIAQQANGTTGGWAGAMSDARADVRLTEGYGKKDGDFGLALAVPVDGVGRFGFHAMHLNSRVPYVSGQVRSGGTVVTAGSFMKGQYDYPELDLYGITFNTRLDNWQLGAELSHSPNQPVQINVNTIIQSGLTYVVGGPQANFGTVGSRMAALPAGQWNYFQGWDRHANTQLTLSVGTPLAQAITSALGAADGRFSLELGHQQSAVPEASYSLSNTANASKVVGTAYGRGLIFGTPVGSALCNASGAAGTNSQPQGCAVDGFFTPSAWGYRLRVALEYPGLVGGWKFTPSLAFAHDVDGYSTDGQFNQGRQVLNLGLTLQHGRQHEVQAAYMRMNRAAAFDTFRDRDNATVVYRYRF